MISMVGKEIIEAVLAGLVAQPREPDQARRMAQIVECICDRGRFHHVGLYMIDFSVGRAIVRAATGEAGRLMLELNRQYNVDDSFVIGQAAFSGEVRLYIWGPDAFFFHSPLLPDTCWQLAVPLRVQGEVIGVLEVRGDKPVDFTLEEAQPFQQVADAVVMMLGMA